MTNDQQTIAYLRTPKAIRERCDRILHLAQTNRLQYFGCNLNQLENVANYVIQVIKDEYPDLNIPFHSRWRHFEVGNVPRLAELEQKLAGLTPLQKAQTQFDLAIISVLLDAGAGADWQYLEAETGQIFRRSEGLAVASFRMFCQGIFSSNPEYPLQADDKGLQNLTVEQLADALQVSQTNPLLGLEGRVKLLQRLGDSLQNYPKCFGEHSPRPGNLVKYLLNCSTSNLDQGIDRTDQASQSTFMGMLPAPEVLSAVLLGFSDIWPGRLAIAGVNLGDVWYHSALSGENPSDHYIPFHKLSQWLTYSLLEPLQDLGLAITQLDELTGLAEYRNGGLCLDLGLIVVKDPAIIEQRHLPGSEVIVEWRALTISLLDRIADTIRKQLNLTTSQLPLVKVLQGGTWTAGRKIAAQLRETGVPPIQIESDGTVF